MAATVAWSKFNGKVQEITVPPGRVLIEPELAKSDLIALPSQGVQRQQATVGRILELGSVYEGFPFVPGDRVMFSRYSGVLLELQEIEENGEASERFLQVFDAGDIICRITVREAKPEA